MSNNLNDSLGYDIQPSEENVNREIFDKFKSIKFNTIERDKGKLQYINNLNYKDKDKEKINNINKLNKLSLNEINTNPFAIHNNYSNKYIEKEKDSYSRNIKY
jgi:hypothetical protein